MLCFQDFFPRFTCASFRINFELDCYQLLTDRFFRSWFPTDKNTDYGLLNYLPENFFYGLRLGTFSIRMHLTTLPFTILSYGHFYADHFLLRVLDSAPLHHAFPLLPTHPSHCWCYLLQIKDTRTFWIGPFSFLPAIVVV